MVSGAARDGGERGGGRVVAMVSALARTGPVDFVVVHDDRAGAPARREWTRRCAMASDVVDRRIEVAAPPLPRGGFVRDVHLHRTDAPERAARRSGWFRVVDAFVLAAPTPPDLLWCADLAAATRAGWLRRSLPRAVDIDGSEDLSSERARRAARATASGAHLVTIDSAERRSALGLPGVVVVATDDDVAAVAARLEAVAEQAAAYRPVRT